MIQHLASSCVRSKCFYEVNVKSLLIGATFSPQFAAESSLTHREKKRSSKHTIAFSYLGTRNVFANTRLRSIQTKNKTNSVPLSLQANYTD
jgi:hypothetical protein